MSKKRVTVVAPLAVAAVILVAIPLNRERILQAAGDFLIVQDELQPADLIHVISGPDNRTDYGIELFKQGFAREIFFTGGWCKEIQGIHAERGRERALAQGIPIEAIGTDGYQVISTYGEALRLKAFIATSPRPLHSVIVVSDSYHMRRARWAYHEVLGDGIRLIMAPVPFDRSPYHRQWWTDDESRMMVQEEYVKLAYYYARYRLTWGPLQAWLASLDTE
jgi:uncharacterized SAM-binding protein YcdF (DUF218 family)